MEEIVDESKEQNEEEKENSASEKDLRHQTENSNGKQDEEETTKEDQNNEPGTKKTEKNKNVAEEKQGDEQKTIPSVEISQHVENSNSDPEKPQVLSVIKEEESSASSVLEIIEGDNLSSSSDVTTNNPLFLLNEDPGNIKQEVTQEKQEKPNISPGLRKTIEDKNIVKENEVLKARISEVNEHLAKARKQITKLQQDLAEFDNETKNPTILLAKLTESIQENDQLKKQISNQTTLVVQANNKETELRERVIELIASEEEKQNQIERLESKVAELVNFIQTTSGGDRKNQNGQTSIDPEVNNILHGSLQNLNRKKMKSKICAIL